MNPNSQSPVRVLWIGRHNSNDRSGEVIFDRKIASILREKSEVVFFEPPRVGKMREIYGTLLGQVWYRGRYNTTDTVKKVRELAQMADVVVCSWEHYDFMVEKLDKPIVLVLHNISSTSLTQIYPDKALARYLANRLAVYERRVYTLPNVRAILALSKRDKATIEAMGAIVPVAWTPPGTPCGAELSTTASFLPELTLSGSYGWSVKRRDAARFFDDVRSCNFTITSDDSLPPSIISGRQINPAKFYNPIYCRDRIRLGVIPDRFISGHKLKGTFFIANNAIILSYADIRDEFEGLTDADLFVRVIKGVEDIIFAMNLFSEMPPTELRERFQAFKFACVQRFNWDQAGMALWHAVKRASDG